MIAVYNGLECVEIMCYLMSYWNVLQTNDEAAFQPPSARGTLLPTLLNSCRAPFDKISGYLVQQIKHPRKKFSPVTIRAMREVWGNVRKLTTSSFVLEYDLPCVFPGSTVVRVVRYTILQVNVVVVFSELFGRSIVQPLK